MHEKSLLTLEYHKILEHVAKEAAFSTSKALVMNLKPSADIEEVRQRLGYTTEACRLLALYADAGIRGAHDIRLLMARVMRGGILSPSDLLEVLATIQSSLYVARLLEKIDENNFPLLRALGKTLPQRPRIVQRIVATINDRGDVLDTASSDLQKVRADVRRANQRLQERLRTLVNEFGNALQEPIVTIRNDRYVVPVKAESRGHVQGIVHDQSSSGATVFVEPLVILELNNRLHQLQIAERQEIERVLRVLSQEIGHEADALNTVVELLAEFDLHLAKAHYGQLMQCREPRLNEQGYIDLRNARHPLLTGKVVPINFHTGRDFFMVIITGPNTGGKTVVLKTVGLFTLMAQAGLHIPADEHSEISVFADVFADIGDEQSIEQSLSTFSSHLGRIIEILQRVRSCQTTPPSDIGATRGNPLESFAEAIAPTNPIMPPAPMLVLLDELGAGTDPSEGSALARAILSFLCEHHVTTVATTHYSELKAFAHEQSGVINAAVEFDVEMLSPTYQLSIGLPGRSNALAIARRLGLDEGIVERSREFLGSTDIQMESLLETLEVQRRAIEDEQFRLRAEHAEAEHLRRELEREQYELEEQRVDILNEARAQARHELNEMQTVLAKARQDMRRMPPNRAWLEETRQQVQQLAEGKRIAPVPQPRHPARREESGKGIVHEPLRIGDTVRVLSFGQNAELLGLSVDHGEADVQMGALRIRVSVDNIERVRKPQAAFAERSMPRIVASRTKERAEFTSELDIHGWRVEKALDKLENYLNDAVMAGLYSVRILHGKGTGALRSAVRKHLVHHPLVKDSMVASPREGGDGVTLVDLNV